MMDALPVIEVFSSIQGEGPFVGVRQIFLRLPKCNLTCPYCDTRINVPGKLRIEKIPGSRQFDLADNPVSIDELKKILKSFNVSQHHSISITGGEPLLWADELQELFLYIKEQKLKIYLETNGTLPNQLIKILQWVDIISMDIKLPFDGQNFWDVHETFLLHSLSKQVFVKIVVDEKSVLQDLIKARDLISSVDSSILTILQPVSQTRNINAPKPYQLLEWQSLYLRKLKDVRVIPQTHVYMGQL
jgi:organic radical activating enzyme